MANFRVVARKGINIREEADINSEILGAVACGEVVIEADEPVTDPAWLPILLEDDTLGWVAREFLEEVTEDFKEIEAVEISLPKVEPGPVIFQRDLTKLYGYPKERAGYLTTIDLREFAGRLGHVRDFQGNQWSCRIYGHEAMAGPLKKAFGLLCERALAGELKTYDGCFNIRKMVSGNSYSVHSWGMAVDFNARWNPYGGEVQFSGDFILCFAEAGFEAGALWSTPDGMHFQLPWIRDWRQSDNPLRARA
jgi:hypothetical protein